MEGKLGMRINVDCFPAAAAEEQPEIQGDRLLNERERDRVFGREEEVDLEREIVTVAVADILF